MTSYNTLLDVSGLAREDIVLRDDGVNVLTGHDPYSDDPSSIIEGFADKDGLAFRAWLTAGGTVGAAVPVASVRSTTVTTLLDSLSSTQRAEITTDHMARLIARSALGPVVLTDPKVTRAATDMNITADAWFTLAKA